MWLDSLSVFFFRVLYFVGIFYLVLMAHNVFMAVCDVVRRSARRFSPEEFALNPGNLAYICVDTILTAIFVFVYPLINVIGYILFKLNPVLSLFTLFRVPIITERLIMFIIHDVGRGWRVQFRLSSYELG